MIAAAFVVGELQAQTWRTMTGNAWSEAANWGGSLPANDGTADLIFSQVGAPSKPRGATVMDQDWNVRSLYWNPTSLDAGVARIDVPGQSPTTLTLQAGLTNASGGRVEIKPAIVLGALQTWHDNTTPGTGLNAPGTYITGAISGPGGIIKTGSGILRLSSTASSYSGGTVIEAGVLEVPNAGSLGSTSSVVTMDGGILRFAAFPVRAISVAMSHGIALGENGGTIQIRNGELSLNGAISGGGALHLDREPDSGAFPSRYTFSGTNSYSGGTVLGAVTVSIDGNGQALGTGAISLQNGAVLRLNAETNLAPGRKVMMKPGSVLVLNTLEINPVNVVDSDPTRTTGGILSLTVANHSTALDMAAVGNGRLFLGSSGNVLYSAPTLGAGADGVYRIGGGSESLSHATPSLTFSGTDNLFTGARSLLIGGDPLPQSSDARNRSTVVLKNRNNYTGGTTLAAGTLALGDDEALGSGSLTLAGGELSTDGGARFVANPITVTAAADNTVAFGGAHKLTLSGTVNLNGASQTFLGSNSAGVTFTSEITNGALGLAQGRWELKAANTFSGGLSIQYGAIVEVASDASLGAAGGSLRLEGGTLRPTASFTSARPLNISSAGGTIDTNGQTITLSGSVSGATLTKTGEGNLILDGTEKSFGTLLISAGTVQVNNNGSTGSMLVGVESGATLGGNGSVGSTSITAGGHLAPGSDTPGQLLINGGLTLRSGAVLDFDLGPTVFDLIILGSGTIGADSGDPVLVNISDAGGLAPNQTYTLMDWSDATAVYAISESTFQLGNSPVPGHFSIAENTLLFTTIPEPASVGLLGMGSLLLLARRRR